MEGSWYYTAVFLDVSQAFDKVWYQGLLYKIKDSFSVDFYDIIKSYLLYRIFRVKYGKVIMQLKEINSGVPQYNVLEPIYYLLYIADLPIALGFHRTLYRRHSYTYSS